MLKIIYRQKIMKNYMKCKKLKAYNFCFIHTGYMLHIPTWKLKTFEMHFTGHWNLGNFVGPVLYFTNRKLIEKKTFRKTTNAVHSAGRPCNQKQHTCTWFFCEKKFNQQMTKIMKNSQGAELNSPATYPRWIKSFCKAAYSYLWGSRWGIMISE